MTSTQTLARPPSVRRPVWINGVREVALRDCAMVDRALLRMAHAYTKGTNSIAQLRDLLIVAPPASALIGAGIAVMLDAAPVGWVVGIAACICAIAADLIAQLVVRRSIQAIQPFESIANSSLTAVERAVLAECAKRCRVGLSLLMRRSEWLGDLEARAAVSTEASATIQHLFALMFEDGSLRPAKHLHRELAAIERCVERVPAEDRLLLAIFVERTFLRADASRLVGWSS